MTRRASRENVEGVVGEPGCLWTLERFVLAPESLLQTSLQGLVGWDRVDALHS